MNMKRMILSMLLMACCTLGIQAQTTQDPDSLYTKGLLTVGTEAPAFPALKNGKWTVVDFWATWCPDCRKEIPTVKSLYEKYGKEVKFIGVSFDTQKANLDKYVEANGIKWEQYSEFKKWKETNISKAYNIQWLPSMYLIDPQGKVAYVTVLAERMGQKLADIFGEK